MGRASTVLGRWTIICATFAAMIVMVGPGMSIARQATRSIVLKPKFTRVSGIGPIAGLQASRRYALVATSRGQDIAPSVVIDDQTGAQQQISAGCTPTALSGVTMALECQGRWSLDDLQTGQSSPITITECEGTPAESCNDWVSAIGSNWLALTGETGNYHEDYATDYQNRETGRVVDQSIDPKLNVDLDSPVLTVPVCSPLAVPEPVSGAGATWPGSLLALGRGFEIATGKQSYLKRCGTQLHIHLTSTNRGASISTSGCTTWTYCPPATNAHSIVWSTNDPTTGKLRSISGIFVPSRRRFTIKLPKTALRNAAVALTDEHLYLRAGDKLWRAPAPTVTKH